MNLQDLDDLAAAMREHGVTLLHYSDGERAIRMSRARAGAGAVSTEPVVVRSPGLGRLVLTHPRSQAPLAVGVTVKRGMQLAVLSDSSTVIAVNAPADGRVATLLAESGAAVGFGDPLLTIIPEAAP